MEDNKKYFHQIPFQKNKTLTQMLKSSVKFMEKVL